MLKRLSTFLAASAVAFLAACGSDGPSFADEIDPATATDLGYEAAYIAEGVVDNMEDFDSEGTFPEVLLAPGMTTLTYRQRLLQGFVARAYARNPRLQIAAPTLPSFSATVCVPVETGIDSLGLPIDTDEDGVPDDYQVSYPANCTEADGDYSWQWRGSFRIRDLAGLFGYRTDFNDFAVRLVTDTANGEYFEMKGDGFDQAVFAASGISQSSDLTYTITSAYEEIAIPTVAPVSSALETYSFSWVYEVESFFDPASDIALESPLPSGTLSLDASFRWLFGSSGDGVGNFRFTLSTPELLEYDEACSDIIDGILLGELNGDETVGFEVDWTGCGSYTVTTFGTTVGAPAVAGR